jgi:hypothetical protein
MIANLEVPVIATADTPALDELIPLRELAAQLPRRRGGKKTHVATVYRWTDRGIRGVRLRYVQCGSVRCSTVAWAHEFFAALTARDRQGSPMPVAHLAIRTPAARREAIERADRELDGMRVR